MGDVLLSGREITRRWGGVVAVDAVSIELARGEVHALIGTNGAGKTTLVNVLAGEIAPSSGTVELRGVEVTRWSQPRRARAGLARSYQRTSVFLPFPVLENCRLAAQSRRQRAWRWWSDALATRETLDDAREAVSRAGLEKLADRTAASLSHGERRQLEVAMCLALRPEVLLLDEPLAGMGAEETESMLALVQSLRGDHAILIVEHDMEAVFRIADRITVMVDGRAITSGAPAEVRANPEVQRAYLGEAP